MEYWEALLMDERAKRLADVLLSYSLNIKKGEKILITGGEAALPFMKEVYKRAINLGAVPYIRVTFPDINEYLYKNGSEDQIAYVLEPHLQTIEAMDAMLSIYGSYNTRNLSGIDPNRIKLKSRANSRSTKLIQSRKEKGLLRWCTTLFPCQGEAQEANMSLADYEDFVYKACHVDGDKAVAVWSQIDKEQERICNILNTKKELRIIAKDTDLKMSIEGRKWCNCCGKVNFPDGEVFTAPVEGTVEGHIRFSFPGIYRGREIEDIRLKFEKGKVVEATAAKGEELLQVILDTDEGSRSVGEIAVGTNYNIQKFTKKILFDEKIGGTVHLALGRAIPESLGKNMSVIHWDMLCDMSEGGEIYADGELIYRDKRFII